MISAKELNPHGYPTTESQALNLTTLYWRMNKVRDAYGKPMVVTSGLRSHEDQERINPYAQHSNHLSGSAVDISDPDGLLNAWCKENEPLLEKVGLWMEERQGVWQHFQIVPPASGHRWFKP